MVNMPYSRRTSYFLMPLIAVLTLTVSSCNYADFRAAMQSPQQTPTPGSPEHLIPKILLVRPHDTTSYTEGLFLDHGFLYESTGQLGHSKLIKEQPLTGKAVKQISLAANDFGEGLALVGNRLIQLT